MNNACTLICPEKACDAALDALGEAILSKIEVAGNRVGWTTLKVTFPTSTLTFTSMVRIKPGDQFSKLVLSMHNFFNVIDSDDEKRKKLVLEAIANTKMFIGVVADPELSDVEGHVNCLFALARKPNALIFTGEAIQDSDGRRLLCIDRTVT